VHRSVTESDRDMNPGVFRRPQTEPLIRRIEPTFVGEASAVPPAPGISSILMDADGRPTEEIERAVARCDVADGNARFFVKVSRSGRTVGHLYDPRSMYGKPTDLLSNDSKSGRAAYEFAEVDQLGYDDYLQYLRSGISSFLRRTERRMLDGL
jgi:hypothetical protein